VIPKRLTLVLGLLPLWLYLGSKTQGRSTKDTIRTKTLIVLGMGLLALVSFLATWLQPWAQSHTPLRQSFQHLELVFLPQSHPQPPDIAVPLLFFLQTPYTPCSGHVFTPLGGPSSSTYGNRLTSNVSPSNSPSSTLISTQRRNAAALAVVREEAFRADQEDFWVVFTGTAPGVYQGQ
jgi:hypothetical protein